MLPARVADPLGVALFVAGIYLTRLGRNIWKGQA